MHLIKFKLNWRFASLFILIILPCQLFALTIERSGPNGSSQSVTIYQNEWATFKATGYGDNIDSVTINAENTGDIGYYVNIADVNYCNLWWCTYLTEDKDYRWSQAGTYYPSFTVVGDGTWKTETWKVTVIEPPKPDLFPTAIELSSTNVYQGEEIEACWKIKNYGDAYADSSEDYVYVNNSYKDSYYTGGLGAGKTSSKSCYSIDTSSLSINNTHAFKVKADGAGEVAEEDENNIKSETFTVEEPPKPDLFPTAIELSSTNVYQGEEIEACWKIKNYGDAYADSSEDYVYVNNSYKDSYYTGGLGAGKTSSKSCYSIDTSSLSINNTHAFKVKADGAGEVAEEDENNIKSETFTVEEPPKPDLFPTAIELSSTNVYQGEEIEACWKIKNYGDAYADSSEDYVYVNNSYKDSYYTGGLGAGKTSSKSCYSIDTSSLSINNTHAFKVKADGAGEVAEEDENNIKSETFTVEEPPKPDLFPTDIELSSNNVYQGEEIEACWKIENDSEAKAGSSHDYVYINNTYIKKYDTGSLDAWETSWEECYTFDTISLGVGSHTFKVIADGADEVDEEDEDNDKSKSFTVKAPPAPNLDILSFIAPDRAALNSQIEVNWKLKNAGDKNADDVEIRFYWSTDEHYGDKDEQADIAKFGFNSISTSVTYGSSISGNASININNISTSYTNLIMVASHPESSDTESTEIAVYQPKPDIVISGFEDVENSYYIGDAIEVTFVGANIGEADSEKGVNYQCALFKYEGSDSYTIIAKDSLADINGLAVNESKEASCGKYEIPSGTIEGDDYFIFVEIDTEHENDESNESNNYAGSKHFSITEPPKPDLDIIGIDYDPDPPVLESDVKFTAHIKNVGAVSWEQGFGDDEFKISFTVDGRGVCASGWNAFDLNVGGVESLSCTADADKFSGSGDKSVIAQIVVGNEAMEEENTSNNTETIEVTWLKAPKPDLDIISFSYTPDPPVLEDKVAFFATVKNVGDAEWVQEADVFYDDFTVEFYVDHVHVCTDNDLNDWSLSVNETEDFSCAVNKDYFTSSGEKFVEAVIVFGKNAMEQDTSNDGASASVHWQPAHRPNLQIKQIYQEPANIANDRDYRDDEEVKICAIAENVGQADADGDFTIRFYQNKDEAVGGTLSINPEGFKHIGDSTVGFGLGAGKADDDAECISVPVDIGGSVQFKAEVDANDIIDEIYNNKPDNEQDNSEEVTFTWPHIYDLEISTVFFADNSQNDDSDQLSTTLLNTPVYINVNLNSSGDAVDYRVEFLIEDKQGVSKNWSSTIYVPITTSTGYIQELWKPEEAGSFQVTASIFDPKGNQLSSNYSWMLSVNKYEVEVYDVSAKPNNVTIGDDVEITGKLRITNANSSDPDAIANKAIYVTLSSGAEYGATTDPNGYFSFVHQVSEADASLEIVGATYGIQTDQYVKSFESDVSELFMANSEIDTSATSTIVIDVDQSFISAGAIWRIAPAEDIFGYNGDWTSLTKINNIPSGNYSIEFSSTSNSLSVPELVNLNITKASTYEIQPNYVYLGEDVAELVSYQEDDGDIIAIQADTAPGYSGINFNYLHTDPYDVYSNFTVTRNDSVYFPPKRVLNLLAAALEKKVYENSFANYSAPVDHLYPEQKIRSFTCESEWFWGGWNTCYLNGPSGLSREERKSSYKAIIKRALYNSPLADEIAYSTVALGASQEVVVATAQMPPSLSEKIHSILSEALGEDLMANIDFGSNVFNNIIDIIDDSKDDKELAGVLSNWLGSNSLSLARDDAALFNNIKQTVGLVEDVYDAVNGFNGLYEQFVILNDVMVRDGLIAAKLDFLQNVVDEMSAKGRADLVDAALVDAISELRYEVMQSQTSFLNQLSFYINTDFTLDNFIDVLDTIVITSYEIVGAAEYVLSSYNLLAKAIGRTNVKLDAFAVPASALELSVNITGSLNEAQDYMREVQLLPNILVLMYDYAGYSQGYLTDGSYENSASANGIIVNTSYSLESNEWLNLYQMSDHFYFDWVSLEVSSINPDWYTVVNSSIGAAIDSAMILSHSPGTVTSNWISLANNGFSIGTELGQAINQWGSDTDLADLLEAQLEILDKYGNITERISEWKGIVNSIYPNVEDLELLLMADELVTDVDSPVNIQLTSESFAKVESIYQAHSWSLSAPKGSNATISTNRNGDLAEQVSFVADVDGIYEIELRVATDYGEVITSLTIQAVGGEDDELPDDSDGDSIPDHQDDFPTDIAASVDSDNDGYPDSWNLGYSANDSTTGLALDACPADSLGWLDTDGDSFCQNTDSFSSDPSASQDSDLDGYPDAWNSGYSQADSTSKPTLLLDMYPNDPSLGGDSDSDGYPELVIGYALDDVQTSPTPIIDLFPLDPSEWQDLDNDGWGDNIDACDDAYGYLDQDSDGVCQPEDELDDVHGRFANAAPVCQVQELNVVNGSTLVNAFDCSDPDFDTLVSVSIDVLPTKGNVSVSQAADGFNFTYTNDASDLTASDYFAYRIHDQYGAISNTSEIFITIAGADNTAPVANDLSFTIQLGEAFIAQLDAYDDEGDKLVYGLLSYPNYGDLDLDEQTGQFIFATDPDSDSSTNYEVSFSYEVSDGFLKSNAATVAMFISDDPDGDGIPSAADNCPVNANSSQLDLDKDSVGDACDYDIDGDRVANDSDAFPYDPTEWTDTDGDSIGNNTDTDDDDDGMPDDYELANNFDPLNPYDADLDADGDGDSNLYEYTQGTDPNDADDFYQLSLQLLSGDTSAELAWDRQLSFEFSVSSSTDNIGDYEFTELSSPQGGTLSYPEDLSHIVYTANGDFVGIDSFSLALAYTSKTSDAIEFSLDIYDPDPDLDGVRVEDDNCPTVANSEQLDLDEDGLGDLCDDDIDGDTYANADDAFPRDPSEWLDTDGDSIGNNTDTDDDGDTMPDVYELANDLDPLDASDAELDADGDGDNNLYEYTQGTDPNDADDFYKLSLQLLSGDTSAELAWDRQLSFEFSVSSSTDNIGDYEFTELSSPQGGTLSYPQDSDHIVYTANGEFVGIDSFSLALAYTGKTSNALEFSLDIYDPDPDLDGVRVEDDNCPTVANSEQLDLDQDGLGDICDDDIDGDTYANADDAFPRDPTEWVDTDGDLIGNNADTDDDGDGMPDDYEVANNFDPLNPYDADLDADGDGDSNLYEYTHGTDPNDADDFYQLSLQLLSGDLSADLAWDRQLSFEFSVSSSTDTIGDYEFTELSSPQGGALSYPEGIQHIVYTADGEFVGIDSFSLALAYTGKTSNALEFSLDIYDPDPDLDSVRVEDDNCPAVANSEQLDLDTDGLGDLCDDDIDGDTYANADDAFPYDSSEWLDTDSDGIGNNADTDDDGDGMPDDYELANGLDPLDASDAELDADGDGDNNLYEYTQGTDPNDADDFYKLSLQLLSGDTSAELAWDRQLSFEFSVSSSTDNIGDYEFTELSSPQGGTLSYPQDSDHIVYTANGEFVGIDSFSLALAYTGKTSNALEFSLDIYDPDPDLDGVRVEDDNCPTVANSEQLDLDQDGLGDLCDDDIDGDTYANSDDAFPYDSSEWLDTDSDGIGNNADTDDDGDGIPDDYELANGLDPLDPSDADADADGDGDNNLYEYTHGTDPNDADDFYQLTLQLLSGDTSAELAWDRQLSFEFSVSSSTDTIGAYEFAELSSPQGGTLSYPQDSDHIVYTANGEFVGIDSFSLALAYTGKTSNSIEFSLDIYNPDPDLDGVRVEDDNCPAVANSEQLDLDEDGLGDFCDDDIDGDNYANADDAFPYDSSEWLDTDSDGIGNNADTDDDGDTMPDDYELANGLDPLDPSDAELDSDGDGDSNLYEYTHGTDPNDADDFYQLSLQLLSGDLSAELAWDRQLSFEFSVSSSTDTIGAYEFAELSSPQGGTLSYPQDSDHIVYTANGEFVGIDSFSLALAYTSKTSNSIEFSLDIYNPDPDLDGVRVEDDNCPAIANSEQLDLDEDSLGDLCDDDIDGDTYSNDYDTFPYDASEWLDTDGDSIGNNADTDDDGDGIPDDYELANGLDPLDPSDADLDSDGDGDSNLYEYTQGTDPNDDSSLYLLTLELLSPDTRIELAASVTATFEYTITSSTGSVGEHTFSELSSPSDGDLFYSDGRYIHYKADSDFFATEKFILALSYAGKLSNEIEFTINVYDDDSDRDGIVLSGDNCPSVANAEQADLDADGLGDACDDDIDGDGFSNSDEIAIGSDPEDDQSMIFPRDLFEGWNLIGISAKYPISVSALPEEVLIVQTIDSELGELGWTRDEQTGDSNNLQELTAGNSYWLKVDSDINWQHSAATNLNSENITLQDGSNYVGGYAGNISELLPKDRMLIAWSHSDSSWRAYSTSSDTMDDLAANGVQSLANVEITDGIIVMLGSYTELALTDTTISAIDDDLGAEPTIDVFYCTSDTNNRSAYLQLAWSDADANAANIYWYANSSSDPVITGTDTTSMEFDYSSDELDSYTASVTVVDTEGNSASADCVVEFYQEQTASAASLTTALNATSATASVAEVLNPQLQAEAGDGQVSLQWQNQSGYTYDLYRSANQYCNWQNYSICAQARLYPQITPPIIDTPLLNNTKYHYELWASSGGQLSASYAISATPEAAQPETGDDPDLNLSLGLVAQYQFITGYADSSGNGLDALPGGDSSIADGQLPLNSTSSNSWLLLPAAVLDQAEDFTVSAWLQLDNSNSRFSSQNYYTLISAANADETEALALLYANAIGNNDAYWQLTIDGSEPSTIAYDGAIADSQWHHLVITRSTYKLRLFIDGELIHDPSTITSGPLTIDASGLIVGQLQTCLGNCFATNSAWLGSIDDLRFYSRALTSPEVEKLFQDLNAH